MRAFDLGQLVEHLGAARIGFALGDQAVDDRRLDLVGPGVDQPRADVGGHGQRA
jgi:hypothetical protein